MNGTSFCPFDNGTENEFKQKIGLKFPKPDVPKPWPVRCQKVAHEASIFNITHFTNFKNAIGALRRRAIIHSARGCCTLILYRMRLFNEALGNSLFQVLSTNQGAQDAMLPSVTTV